MSFNLKQGWAEDYVGMWSNGLWNDFRGDHNFYGFVCEAETVCGKKKFFDQTLSLNHVKNFKAKYLGS